MRDGWRAGLGGVRRGAGIGLLGRVPWHWPVLCGWLLVWFLAKAQGGGQSWHFSAQGARLLWLGADPGRPSGRLDLFANYPQLQSGPLTFVLAGPLTRMGPDQGVVAAEVVMAVLCLVALAAVELAAVALRPDLPTARIRCAVLVGGMALIPLWALTGAWFAHFDDVLALTFTAVAVCAAARGQWVLLGGCLAMAVDSKPWAAAFLPLLGAMPGSLRRSGERRRAALLTLGLILLAWLPFFVADPETRHALQFSIGNAPDSALRALGVNDPGTPPWDRWAQIAGGCLLGAVAVRRRRWPAAVLIGVCARIALEPNDYGYYFTGLVLGALCWDLLAAREALPVMTLGVTTVVMALPTVGVSPHFDGVIKLLAVVCAAGLALFGPARAVQPTVAASWPEDGRLAASPMTSPSRRDAMSTDGDMPVPRRREADAGKCARACADVCES